jgi:hypothetical protein
MIADYSQFQSRLARQAYDELATYGLDNNPFSPPEDNTVQEAVLALTEVELATILRACPDCTVFFPQIYYERCARLKFLLFLSLLPDVQRRSAVSQLCVVGSEDGDALLEHPVIAAYIHFYPDDACAWALRLKGRRGLAKIFTTLM